ncbi:MAG TPA: hypothetical protein VMV89_08515 [Candidatus Paceibacterota bacterium]|nr:hypothetical protein [Candidatus Paceibacterota bacterium]
MKSPIFNSGANVEIENQVLKLLNQQVDFLSERTAESTRAASDAIQSIIEDNFEKILGKHGGEYSASFARRAMADLAFKDKIANNYVVDVKTHREETAFNMPNLTSVDRLARFYEDDSNYFVMLMVKYGVTGTRVTVSKVHFVPIEHLKWSCLTIGALGTGQIQIANSKHIEIDATKTRRAWMLDFCDNILEFYPREIAKTTKRISQFEKVKKFWLEKKDA